MCNTIIIKPHRGQRSGCPGWLITASLMSLSLIMTLLLMFLRWPPPVASSQLITLPWHMSAEPKWCFLNWPKGGTNIFALRTPHWFRGYVSPNQIHLLFGTFGQKMGQKGLKIGLKCLGLVWYGLAWAACDPGSWLSPKLCSKLSKIAKLKVWYLGVREES